MISFERIISLVLPLVSVMSIIDGKIEKIESIGKTVVLVAIGKNVVGIIAIADTIKKNSRVAIRKLQRQ